MHPHAQQASRCGILARRQRIQAASPCPAGQRKVQDPGCTFMHSHFGGVGKGEQDPDCTPVPSCSGRCRTKVHPIPNCPRVCRAKGCRTRTAPLVSSQSRRCKIRTSGCRTRAATPCPASPGAQDLEKGLPHLGAPTPSQSGRCRTWAAPHPQPAGGAGPEE